MFVVRNRSMGFLGPIVLKLGKIVMGRVIFPPYLILIIYVNEPIMCIYSLAEINIDRTNATLLWLMLDWI
jgi:hypothetical protein